MSALASFGNCGKVQGAYSRVIRAPETQVKDWTHVYVGVLGKGGLTLTMWEVQRKRALSRVTRSRRRREGLDSRYVGVLIADFTQVVSDSR